MERFETELAHPNSAGLSDNIARAHRFYDPDYRERLQKEVTQMQAETIRVMAMAVGRGVGAVFRKVFRFLAMVAEGSAAVRLYEKLSALDDAQLAELGLERGQIGQCVVDTMGIGAGRVRAGLSAIEGGRRDRPAKTEDLPHLRAA